MESVPSPKPTPIPRGPPPIPRSNRPRDEPIQVIAPPPPLETPPLWGELLSKFEYPSPDHSSKGIDLFNQYVHYPINELHSAAISIFGILYPDETFVPKLVKSPVKLVMRDMDGVAHAANGMSYSGPFVGQASRNVTHTSDFVFSTQYLSNLATHSDPLFEIRGIIYHELTHTYQYSAENAPGGLIEGIADFVRLRGGFEAKHWREDPNGKKWDQGYEATAYFLDWVDKNVYEGIVALVNQWLGNNKAYDEGAMFDEIMPGWSWYVVPS